MCLFITGLAGPTCFSFCGEVDDDSDAHTEFEPSKPSNHPFDKLDAELSPDYGSINTVEEAYDDELDNQDAVQHHKEAFYRIYRTHLIDDTKYEELVKLLSNPLPKGATMMERNNRRNYRTNLLVI
jgi:hypothetical protein